jgi:hypothetical protein
LLLMRHGLLRAYRCCGPTNCESTASNRIGGRELGLLAHKFDIGEALAVLLLISGALGGGRIMVYSIRFVALIVLFADPRLARLIAQRWAAERRPFPAFHCAAALKYSPSLGSEP